MMLPLGRHILFRQKQKQTKRTTTTTPPLPLSPNTCSPTTHSLDLARFSTFSGSPNGVYYLHNHTQRPWVQSQAPISSLPLLKRERKTTFHHATFSLFPKSNFSDHEWLYLLNIIFCPVAWANFQLFMVGLLKKVTWHYLSLYILFFSTLFSPSLLETYLKWYK